MVARFTDWIDQQTGWVTGWRGFFAQPVPERAGIGHVLGALALILFIVCAASGIFLLFYYAPTPDHAHDSVRYIDQDLTWGSLVRGLHFWSANALALVIGIHILRVFLWAAYKRPRQMMWVLGVILLLITMGESITGYLLPWSENGYWATVVRTEILGAIPLVGAFAKRLLLNGETLGALALSRFFSLHTLFLPIAFLLVGSFHVSQVRVKGITPPFERVDSEATGPTRPFHPYITIRLAVISVIALAVCAYVAWQIGAPVEPRANPNIPYQAHTSWNWMYLYEWARFFPGKWEFIGVVVIPALGVLALLVVPYLDRNPERRLRKRPVALALVTVTFLAVTGLGIAGLANTPREPKLTPLELRGQRVFLDQRCNACHGINGGGGTGGPDLAAKTARSPDEMERLLRHPQAFNRRSIMPATEVSQADIRALVAYMMSLRPSSRMPIEPLVGPPKPSSHFDEDWMVAHKFEVRRDPTWCEECHEPRFCQTCHQNRVPDSHTNPQWLKGHSGAALEGGEYCRVCHPESYCDACHQGVLHGPDWLAHHRTVARTHSKICSSCHTKSLCIECHKGAEPPSHSPGWLRRHGPASRAPDAGCATCHPPSQCSECHKTRRPPSHNDPAWPKEHGATAAMGFQDCTLCHGADSCAVCHRGVKMPHPQGWDVSHGNQGATFEKTGPCFACHEEAMCEECHGPSEN